MSEVGTGEHTIEGFRVVPCRRHVRGIREGDPVVLLPVEAVLADARLLALPTVRRMARAGMRGCVLVPLSEWRDLGHIKVAVDTATPQR